MDPTVFLFHLLHGVQRSPSSSSSLCSKPPHQSDLSRVFPLLHHSHLRCFYVIRFLLLPLPPPLLPHRRRVSAPARPKRQPLRLEAGQRGQRPVGEADGPLRRPPQVRLSRVSSWTQTRSGLRRFKCLGFRKKASWILSSISVIRLWQENLEIAPFVLTTPQGPTSILQSCVLLVMFK